MSNTILRKENFSIVQTMKTLSRLNHPSTILISIRLLIDRIDKNFKNQDWLQVLRDPIV